MRAQHLAQRRVQQVRGGVIEADGAAPRRIDAGRDGITHRQRRALERPDVDDGLVELLCVGHVEARAAGAQQRAGVTHLAAALGIERRAREHHFADLAGLQRRHERAVAPQRHHPALGLEGVVADELTLRRNALAGAQVDAELAGRARAFALEFHLALVAFHVDAQSAFAGDVGGKVGRETVGIVQQEQQRTGHRLAAGHGHARFELCHASHQRLGKTLFLGAQHAGDLRTALAQLGIGVAHDATQHRHQLVEERLRLPELVAVAHGATDDPAQHVATPFVGGHHAIAHEETAGADVIGDHA